MPSSPGLGGAAIGVPEHVASADGGAVAVADVGAPQALRVPDGRSLAGGPHALRAAASHADATVLEVHGQAKSRASATRFGAGVRKTTNWTLILILAGVVLRLAAVALMDIQQDGSAYAAMGKALHDHGSFWMPWGDGLGFNTDPAPSHHYPPLYPAYLALWYSAWGFGVDVTKLANLVLSFTTVLVVYAATRNLYGPRVAALTAGLFSVIPRFIVATGTGFSENLVVLVFTLTIWAGLRGLKQPAYLVLAGLFAGLAFLAKAGMGPFFALGIASGLWWRIKYQGAKGTFTNKSYVAGGFIFVLLAGSWSLRNILLWGDWQSSNYIQAATSMALQHPVLLSMGLLFKGALYVLILALFYAIYGPEWKKAWQERQAESLSILWLSIGLVAFIGCCMAAVLWVVEQTPPFWMDAERYLCLVYVPLMWLLFRHSQLTKSFKIRHLMLAGIFVFASVYQVLEPTRSPEDSAATHLAGILQPGDQLGIQNATLGRYSFYAYLPTQDVSLTLCNGNVTDPCQGAWPDFILGRQPVPSPAYRLIHTDWINLFPFGHGATIYTYQRVAA
jgi:4-amino-4-deoxy-L-arabinose transferase-like glycosyltransferase